MLRAVNSISYNPPSKLTTATFSPGSTETILSSVLIPASTVIPYDLLGIQVRVVKVPSESSLFGLTTVKIRIGPTISTSETQVAILQTTTASQDLIQMNRRLSIQNITTDTKVFSTSTSQRSDHAFESTTSISSLAIDWTVANYIIVSATSSSSSEVLNCGYIVTDLLPSISPS